MAWPVPRALRRLARRRSRTSSTRCRCAARVPAVVTIHDLSFERDPSVMGRRDRLDLPRRRPARGARAARVLAVSERTKDDLVELYGVAAGADRRHAARRRRRLSRPGTARRRLVPAARRRGPGAEEPARRGRRGRGARAAARRRRAEPRRRGLADELERRGADVRGYVTQDELVELYRGAACLVMPSRYEGFGLPVARGDGVRHAGRRRAGRRAARGRRRRGRLRRARASWPTAMRRGARRAGARSWRRGSSGRRRSRWDETARRTLAVYREVLGSHEGLGGRHLARPPRGARRVAARRSLPQVDEVVVIANLPGSAAGRSARRPRDRAARGRAASPPTSTPAWPRRRRARPRRQPGCGARAGRGRRRSATFMAGAPALRRRRARSCSTPTAAGSRRAAASRRSGARSSGARRCGVLRPAARAPARPLPPRRAADRAGRRPTGCSAGSSCSGARCSTSSAASTRASGCTARRSTSATGRRRRGGSAGTSRPRWSRHRWDALTDQRLLDAAHALALARACSASSASTPSALEAL